MRLKYHIISSLIVILILIAGCTSCQREIEEDSKVVFEDQVFQIVFDRREYKENIGDLTYITAPLTKSQLDKMTALNLYFLEGEECSLKDLKKFPNLRGLLISNASPYVIQQVSEQKQLKINPFCIHIFI